MGKLFLTVSFLIAITANAQWWGSTKTIRGNGDITTITRSTSGYNTIDVSGNLKVYLMHGEEGTINLTGESNLLPYVVTEVHRNSLKIYIKKGYALRYGRAHNMVIKVPFNLLNQVTLSGSGDIISTDPIQTKNFKTVVSGSGDIELVLTATITLAQVNGSGDIKLKGSTHELDMSVKGSGDIKGYEFEADSVTASVTGSGDIQTYAANAIRARVTGSGDIFYKGNPAKEDTKIIGSGDITRQ
ncbi:head GIN domain-containing protein [Aquimarina sp. W85]|uniref:head GIN domain-containing protein n=1 Tax=Aquimarina rhodophyticola TaxID=3342246 RepID=UPI0036706D88